MPLIRARRDAKGRLRALAATREAAIIADFFETDIDENPFICNTMIDAAKSIESGETQSHSMHGNVYTVALSSQKVHISNMHDDNALGFSLPLDEFLALLYSWRNALHQDREPLES